MTSSCGEMAKKLFSIHLTSKNVLFSLGQKFLSGTKMFFLIFTAFSQYQWLISLQLGYFISLQFIWKSNGKKTFAVKAFFRVENGIFPHGKRLSLEKGLFPHGKRLSLEKGLFPLEIQVNCNGQCPTAKEGIAPAIAGDLLIRFQNWTSEVGVLSLAPALDQSRY